MTSSQHSASDNVDENEEFIGREWVFGSLAEWLHGSQPMLLLTGGPGSGKSTLLGHLVNVSRLDRGVETLLLTSGPLTVRAHFCRASDYQSLDPGRFVEALASAFKELPGFNEAISRARETGPSIHGHAIAIHASSHATVAGVWINQLRLGHVPPLVSFEFTIRRPLEILGLDSLPGTMLILVDGLDEALTYRSDENIVSLFAAINRAGWRPPAGLRFLFTSRRDPRVLESLRLPSLDLQDDTPAGVDDVATYVNRRLESLGQPAGSTIAQKVASAADGNFLYAYYAVNRLLAQPDSLSGLERLVLPRGLDAQYRHYLERELRRPDRPEHWEERYRPLLGLLAVARGNGLDRTLLSAASNLPTSTIGDAMVRLGQYLASIGPRGPYRLYHESFREFLTTDSQFHVYPEEAEQVLRRECARYFDADFPDATPSYVIDHGLEHLISAGDARMFRVESRRWQEAKFRRGHPIDAVADDLRTVMRSAPTRTALAPGDHLRCAIALADLQDRAYDVPLNVIQQLIRHGRVGTATTYAELSSEPSHRAQAHLLIAAATQDERTIRLALAAAHQVVGNDDRDRLLGDIAVALCSADQVTEGIAAAHRIVGTEARGQALARLAACPVAGDRAARLWDAALGTMRLDASERLLDYRLARMIGVLLRDHRIDHAAAATCRVVDSRLRSIAVGNVARHLTRAGRPHDARTILPEVDMRALATDTTPEYVYHGHSATPVEFSSHESFEALIALAEVSVGTDKEFDAAVVGEWIRDARRRDNYYVAVTQFLAEAQRPGKGLDIARSISSQGMRTKALANVARSLADSRRRRDVIQEALDCARAEGSLRDRLDALSVLVELGDGEDAPILIDELVTAAEAFSAHHPTSEELTAAAACGAARAGQLDAAMTMARNCARGWSRGSALMRLAEAVDNAELATELAREASDEAAGCPDDSRDSLLNQIAAVFARAGHAREAVTAAESISSPWFRAHVLANVASLVDDGAEAGPIIEAALRVVRPDERRKTDLALADVSEDLASRGHAEPAILTARAVQIPWARCRAFARVAIALKDRALAAGAALEALTTVRQADADWMVQESLPLVAEALVGAGLAPEALSLARAAPQWQRDSTFAAVTTELLRLGLVAQAWDVARKADPDQRKDLWSDVARGMARAGRVDEVMQYANDVDDMSIRAILFANSVAFLPVTDTSLELARSSLSTAESVPRDRTWTERDRTLTLVATALARTVFTRLAIRAARAVADPLQRQWTLTIVASELAQAGRVSEALRAARSANGYSRAQNVADVVMEVIRSGRKDEGLRLAFELGASDPRVGVLGEVAGGLARLGYWADCLRVANALDGFARDHALRSMVVARAEAGDTEEALRITQEVGDAEARAQSLAVIAGHMVDDARAGETAESALQCSRRGLYGDELAEAASALARAGRLEQAIALVTPRGDQGLLMPGDGLRGLAKRLARQQRYDLAVQVAGGVDSRDLSAATMTGPNRGDLLAEMMLAVPDYQAFSVVLAAACVSRSTLLTILPAACRFLLREFGIDVISGVLAAPLFEAVSAGDGGVEW